MAVDTDGSVVNLYGVGVCPITVFARDGRVRDTNLGNLTEAAAPRQDEAAGRVTELELDLWTAGSSASWPRSSPS